MLARKVEDRDRTAAFCHKLRNLAKVKKVKAICAACASAAGEDVQKDQALWDTQCAHRSKRSDRITSSDELPCKRLKVIETICAQPPLSQQSTSSQCLSQPPSQPTAIFSDDAKVKRLNSWKSKYLSLCGTISAIRHHYFLVRRHAARHPVSVDEKKALHVLCHRKEKNHHGLSSVKVGQRTYVRTMAPRKANVGKRHVRRRAATVKDTAEWICSGDSEAITQVQDKLRADLQPVGTVRLQIPMYGTLQLKAEMVLSNWQLRTMRRLLGEWGGSCQERRLGVAELHSQLHELQRKECDQSARVVKAQSGLQCSRTNLMKSRGDHVSALHSILDDLAISRTAYFGHPYIGKYCKFLCTPAVASAITSPLLLRFSDRDRAGRRTPEFLAANNIRQRWRETFIKWGHVQELMGASVDFVEHPHLVDVAVVRTASYAGFMAVNFPSHGPLPKEYITATQAVEFIHQHGFCGLADEEPMESQHADLHRLWLRYRCCKDRATAVRVCLRSVHVRNNTKILVASAAPTV